MAAAATADSGETKKATSSSVASPSPSPSPLASGDMWLFGYGSLIWKPNFVYAERRVGSIHGYKRRFYQGSTDHRGVPGKPGRVVTLIPVGTNTAAATASAAAPASASNSASAAASGDSKPSGSVRTSAAFVDGEDEPSRNDPPICYGMCYRIAAANVQSVLTYLDVREQGGYTQEFVPVYFRNETGTSANGSDQSTSTVRALVYLATTENTDYLGPAPLASLAQQIATSKGPSGYNSTYLFELANALRALNIVDRHVFALDELVKNIVTANAAAAITTKTAAAATNSSAAASAAASTSS